MNGDRTVGVATFAAGCFWGVEALFQHVRGVLDTVVGYTGGTTANPTYADVCGGRTGHAEAVQTTYDPAQISYRELVERFFENHDATVWRKPQYRSAIFVHSPEQHTIAHTVKDEIEIEEGKRLATALAPLARFYRAEDYHQRYLERRGAAAAAV
jgi:peptide-methionine (S)-S-oxide reductase